MTRTPPAPETGTRTQGRDEVNRKEPVDVLESVPEVQAGSVKITSTLRQAVTAIADNDLPGLAAEMAYHSALAIFPFLLFLAGLTSFGDELFGIDNMPDRIASRADAVMPGTAAGLLKTFVNDVAETNGAGAVLFGLAGMLWAGSNAMGSAMKGLNRISDASEDRNMVWRKLVAMLLAVVFGGVLLLSVLLVVFGSFFASALADWLAVPDLDNLIGWMFWPASLVFIGLAVALLYWLGPCLRRPFRWVTPGACLFVAGWLLASAVFGLYISNVGDFNRTYGTLAAFIILLVWLYWSNLLVLGGAQLNILLEKSDAGRAPRREPKGTRAQP